MDSKKYGSRNWALYDDYGNLICVAVYKKGALEVLNRLLGEETRNHSYLRQMIIQYSRKGLYEINQHIQIQMC